MKKYALCNATNNGENNAGSKASRDAVKIAAGLGYELNSLFVSKDGHTTPVNALTGAINTLRLCARLRQGDIVFLQYPINRQLMRFVYKALNLKKVHIITLIHDIDFLRNVPLGEKGVEGMKELELSLLSQSEYLICHNSSMIKALKEEKLDVKFISLELFDYLYSGENAKHSDNLNEVIVAGNLLEKKAGYLYKLDSNNHFKLSLYGSNLGDNFKYENAQYNGSFTPDELISNMCGSYGLVWDGPELDTCSGNYGKYLKINNPHKVSLYLAAGLPVVVWRDSALYPFVAENGVGFGVASLNELDSELEKYASHYAELSDNVKKIQKKVQNGDFLTSALTKAENMISSQ